MKRVATKEDMAKIAAMRRTIPPKQSSSFSFPLSTEHYHAVERMVCKAAHKYSRIFALPFEEVRAQANFLYVHAARKYREGEGTKFSTFLHIVLRNGLVSYGKARAAKILPQAEPIMDDDGNEVDPLELIADERAEREYRMAELWHSLSADERELVELALDGFAASMERLRALALARLHFDEPRFAAAVRGVKRLLRDMAA